MDETYRFQLKKSNKVKWFFCSRDLAACLIAWQFHLISINPLLLTVFITHITKLSTHKPTQNMFQAEPQPKLILCFSLLLPISQWSDGSWWKMTHVWCYGAKWKTQTQWGDLKNVAPLCAFLMQNPKDCFQARDSRLTKWYPNASVIHNVWKAVSGFYTK